MENMDHNAHSVYLMYYHLIMESHWKNGIMMLIMCMLCFGHSQNQNSVNLSMLIKVPAAGC